MQNCAIAKSQYPFLKMIGSEVKMNALIFHRLFVIYLPVSCIKYSFKCDSLYDSCRSSLVRIVSGCGVDYRSSIPDRDFPLVSESRRVTPSPERLHGI